MSAAKPPARVVVHVGPHKTGTTAIQHACHESRQALAAAGVHYAGSTPHPLEAVWALNARHGREASGIAPSRRAWPKLADEVRSAAAPHVFVSSEFFSDSPPAAMAQMLDDFGGDVDIVITVRPLAHVLASQWQQYVQNGMRRRLDSWAQAVLEHWDEDPELGSGPTPSFWRRHRHDLVVKRWTDLVGTERVTVVAPPPRDREAVLRACEQVLGVSEGTLRVRGELVNRSLTAAEAELLLRVNRSYRRLELDDRAYQHLIRFGMARHLQARRPAASERSIKVRQDHLDLASRIGGEMARAISSSGVRVIGDVQVLSDRPSGGRPIDDPDHPHLIPASVASRAVIGAIVSSGLVSGDVPSGQSRLPVTEIVRALWERGSARVTRR